MLNGEKHESSKYKECLQKASKSVIKFALLSGMAIGFVFFVQYATFSLGFWWGSRLVEENYANPVSATGFYDAGDVLVVFFSVLMAGFNLSQLSPAFEKIVQGRQAAARIFATIDREPLIKSPENGLKPERIDGVIRF